MTLFKPSELHRFLKTLHIQPQKRLSQNFLIDGNIIKKIVAAANLSTQDCVLEIGPGPGALTEALLASGAEVVAIEKDRLLAQHLQHRFQNRRLYMIEGDFRSVDLKTLLHNRYVKVVANIPYHLAGWILQQLLPRSHEIHTIHLILQKEIADRCVAKVGNKNYSSFSLFTQYYSKATLLYIVPPTCFYPKPKVYSAILQLQLQPTPPVQAPFHKLFTLIRPSFQQKRKMLRVSLKTLAPSSAIEQALISIGSIPTARPQNLTLAKFSQLTGVLMAKAWI